LVVRGPGFLLRPNDSFPASSTVRTVARRSAILTLRLENYGTASTTTTRALVNGAGFSWLMLNSPLVLLKNPLNAGDVDECRYCAGITELKQVALSRGLFREISAYSVCWPQKEKYGRLSRRLTLSVLAATAPVIKRASKHSR